MNAFPELTEVIALFLQNLGYLTFGEIKLRVENVLLLVSAISGKRAFRYFAMSSAEGCHLARCAIGVETLDLKTG